MSATVFVTRPLPEPGTAVLRAAGLDVRMNVEDRPLTADELHRAAGEADALLCMLSDRVDDALLDAAPRVRVVANFAVGYDNIDVGSARARGVEVTTTPGVLTDASADLTWALLLAAARNIGPGERLVRSGGWAGWSPTQLLGQPLRGRRLGIFGMGAIGRAVARRARGFDMEVVYHNRRRVPPGVEAELGASYVSTDELLRTSDFVSLNAPLNDESRHVLDRSAFERMKPSAVLVNTGRGALIDEAVLVEVLRERRIAAAGLDVYEFEPRITEGLSMLDNVVLAPHLGSADVEARAAMVELCSRNIIEVLAGRPAVTPAPG